MWQRYCLYLLLVALTTAVNVEITVREKITQECPTNVGDGEPLIDADSVDFDWESIYSSGADALNIVDTNGKKSLITFPGCYNLTLKVKVLKPLRNPYAEVFLQMGGNIPCKEEKRKQQAEAELEICTNMTRPADWCPPSRNKDLRRMLEAKESCHFCNVCAKGRTIAEEVGTSKVEVHDGVRVTDQCEVTGGQDRHILRLTVCTPDRSELRQGNSDLEGRLDTYWEYLKQGTLQWVVHILEREELRPSSRRHCTMLCQAYAPTWKRLSVDYRSKVRKQMEQVCTPVDNYVACVYSTSRFDVVTRNV